MGLSFPVFEWIARVGFLGVDVFFVISGLVIAKSIEKPTKPIVFIKKRFLRIFLGYWPMFALAWVVHFFYHSDRLAQLDLLGSFTLLNVSMQELLISPSWSLSFELYFYALMALALLISIKKRMLLMVGYSGLILLKINLMGYGQSLLLDFMFSPLVMEFFAGFCLWHFREQVFKLPKMTFMLGSVALGLGVYLEAYNGGLRVLTFGFFAFALVVLAVWSEKYWRLRSKNWLTRIGDASYTLYLLHTIVLGWFFSVGLRDWLVNHDYVWTGFWGLITVTCVMSYLLYRLIEKPLYQEAITAVRID